MQSKRGRLRLPGALVNAGLMSLVFFSAAACTKEDKNPATEAETRIVGTPSFALSGTVELPVAWSTKALKGPISDIALAGGNAPLMAVAYEGSGLQLFTLKAEAFAEPGPYSVTRLADGQHAVIDGAALTLFPGINRDGELKAYVYGDGLVAPVSIDLPVNPSSRPAGLCTAPAISESDGLFRLAYWTELSPDILHSGRIVEVNGDITWLPDEAVDAGSPIKSCVLTRDGAQTSGGSAIASTTLARPGFQALISLDETGGLSLLHEDLGHHPVRLIDGISVSAPQTPIAISALGEPRDGGYPGGVIIVAGETAPDEHKVVFVDTGVLTLLASE